MNHTARIPSNNSSSSVMFILRKTQKRRSMAIAKAKLIQGEQGIVPKLVAVK